MPPTSDRDLRSTPVRDQHGGIEPDFVSTRVFTASRGVVFRAFMDPDILSRWWGPAGFTNTFREFNPTPGGVWRFTMHGPDGSEHEMENEFVTILPDEQIELLHHQPAHNFRLDMSYADEAGNTRLTWRIWFESAGEAERVRPFLNQANEENYDRLETQIDALRNVDVRGTNRSRFNDG
jgi:uncharacterized protein YndB with AHSA1/START domain